MIAERRFDVAVAGEVPTDATLFAWPPNEVLGDLEVGEKIHLEPVGAAQIDRDGSFEVRVEDAEALQDYASEFGEVNLVLAADNGQIEFSESFSISSEDATGEDADVVDLGAVSKAGKYAPTARMPRTSQTQGYMEKSCSITKRENLGNHWIPVGGLFSTNSGTKIDFQYSSGQSSSLGAAISYSGATPGFSAGGTVSVSSTDSIDFPTMSVTGSKLVKTKFRYGRYENTCRIVNPGGVTYVEKHYFVRPDLWVGGSYSTTVSAPKATYCIFYEKGTKHTKDKHQQVRWTGAASFYGVGLSAQTGWSTKGRLVVDFKSKAGNLCGAGGFATESKAYQIVAK